MDKLTKYTNIDLIKKTNEIVDEVNKKIGNTDLARVAITGDYNDLTNKPTVVKTVNNITPDINGNVNITVAVPTVTDTKVTNTLATTTKAYITGTTDAITNTGTQVFDTEVYLDTTAGTLVAKTFKTSTGIEIY